MSSDRLDIKDGELSAHKDKLKQVPAPKETAGHSEQEIDAMKALFSQHGGDADKLCAATGADKTLWSRNPPSDDADFAVGMLQGRWTVPDGA